MARRLPCPIFAALHDLDRLLWRLNSRPEKRPVMVQNCVPGSSMSLHPRSSS